VEEGPKGLFQGKIFFTGELSSQKGLEAAPQLRSKSSEENPSPKPLSEGEILKTVNPKEKTPPKYSPQLSNSPPNSRLNSKKSRKVLLKNKGPKKRKKIFWVFSL